MRPLVLNYPVTFVQGSAHCSSALCLFLLFREWTLLWTGGCYLLLPMALWIFIQCVYEFLHYFENSLRIFEAVWFDSIFHFINCRSCQYVLKKLQHQMKIKNGRPMCFCKVAQLSIVISLILRKRYQKTVMELLIVGMVLHSDDHTLSASKWGIIWVYTSITLSIYLFKKKVSPLPYTFSRPQWSIFHWYCRSQHAEVEKGIPSFNWPQSLYLHQYWWCHSLQQNN